MLTPKQKRMMGVIERGLRDNGYAPTYEEICKKLHMASKASAHRMIRALEERGYIRRLPNRPRAIEVLHSVLDPRPAGAPPSQPVVELQLLGYVAAGEPVVVWEDSHRYVAVPGTHVRRSGDHYALEVRGESMIGAGILDGDTVVVRSQARVEIGEIAVALVDGEETTLKRFDRDGDIVVLRAENPDFEDIHLHPSRVEIQGRLTGLLRSYS